MNSYWLVVTGCHQFGIFPEILGLSSSQLTHSYFSEGFVPTTNQLKTWYPTSEVFCRIQLSENWGGGIHHPVLAIFFFWISERKAPGSHQRGEKVPTMEVFMGVQAFGIPPDHNNYIPVFL